MSMVPGSWDCTSDLCTDMLHNMQPYRHSTLCLYQWRRGDNLTRTKPKPTPCWTLILNIIIWHPARDGNRVAKWSFKNSSVLGIPPITWRMKNIVLCKSYKMNIDKLPQFLDHNGILSTIHVLLSYIYLFLFRYTFHVTFKLLLVIINIMKLPQRKAFLKR